MRECRFDHFQFFEFLTHCNLPNQDMHLHMQKMYHYPLVFVAVFNLNAVSF